MSETMQTELQATESKNVQVAGNGIINGYKVVVGEETGPITIVKDSYHVCHNQDFTGIVNQMSDISGFDVSGYSEFYNGNVVIGHLKNNLTEFKIGDHKIEDYIVLGNSHNGTKKFFVGTTTNLVRCSNQFSQISVLESIKHTKSAVQKFEDLMEGFKRYLDIRKRMYEKFEMFQDIKVDGKVRELVIRKMLEIKDEDKLEDISTRKQNQFELIDNRMISEMEDLGDNLFGIFQGATYYTSHDIVSDNKGFGNLFGSAQSKNQKAFAAINQIAEEKRRILVPVMS
jgi:hypothetical protein